MQTKPVPNDTLLRQLRWRYATKKFDPTRQIPAEDWQTLETALVLAPSSFGLQPWKFLVITDPATREKLRPASWNQAQVVECSHFVVFAIPTRIELADLDRYLRRIATVRGVPEASLDFYRKMMVGSLIEGQSDAQRRAWCTRQAYIALGVFMTSAALLGIDTCPMEGLVPEQYDEILGLAPKGLATAVACAAGYRAADDKYAALPKVRYPAEDLIERL